VSFFKERDVVFYKGAQYVDDVVREIDQDSQQCSNRITAIVAVVCCACSVLSIPP
jgi:hypothetical protein